MKKSLIVISASAVLLFSLYVIRSLPSKNPTDEVSNNNFNIVLITIDTLRADHLSIYGYHRKTSPAIDKIAEQGIVFKNAFAPSSWTPPSMASLFTSVYPINHGVMHGTIYGWWTVYEREIFSNALTTLPEILQTYGYNTFGVASNLNLDKKFGFARGFNYFKCLSWVDAHSVNEVIYSWESDIRKSDKYFLWIHYFDPHVPYLGREPWINQYTSDKLSLKLNFSNVKMDALVKLIPFLKNDAQALDHLKTYYDSEINYVDSYIEKLIKKFEFDKNTLFIITSDHGEEFLEHGQIGHGNNLYQETVRIPLIIKLPFSSKAKIVEKNVNLIDVTPTILDILNISPPEHALGKSLLNEYGSELGLKSTLRRIITLGNSLLKVFVSDYNFAELDTKSILKTIITSEWKYTYNYKDNTEQLYNIKSDPLELRNLAAKKKGECTKLKKKLFKWVSTAKKYPARKKTFKITPEEKEKLKALGYIQ